MFREYFALEKENQRCEWMGHKSYIPGHLASYHFLVTVHAEGGRNWMTDPDLAYHSWIISLIPIWQHTEVLSSSLCQMCFCMHGYWYDIQGGKCEETALKLKPVSFCVGKVRKCMYITSFWKYFQTWQYVDIKLHEWVVIASHLFKKTQLNCTISAKFNLRWMHFFACTYCMNQVLYCWTHCLIPGYLHRHLLRKGN